MKYYSIYYRLPNDPALKREIQGAGTADEARFAAMQKFSQHEYFTGYQIERVEHRPAGTPADQF